MECHNEIGKCLRKPQCFDACAVRMSAAPRFADHVASANIPNPLPLAIAVSAVIKAAGDEQARISRECDALRRLINISLGLMDSPKYANLVDEVAKMVTERDELRAALATSDGNQK